MFMESPAAPLSAPAPFLIEHGVEIPTRVFVGNLPYDTNDMELKQFFSQYGDITDCNIVYDRQGVSKGYGFITFLNQEQAHNVLSMETILYKTKELHLSKAIRRQSSQQYQKSSKEYINGIKRTFILPNHCQPGKMIYSVMPGYSPGYPPQITSPQQPPSFLPICCHPAYPLPQFIQPLQIPPVHPPRRYQ